MYDLSGGNKMMAFAAYQSARDGGSRVADLENIRHRYRLRLYEFDGHLVMKEDVALPGVISIADYLNAHLPGFEEGGFSRDKRGRTDVGGHFEETIYRTLAPHVDEIMAGVRPAGVAEQIEIDMIVRRGNAVGIISKPRPASKKRGLTNWIRLATRTISAIIWSSFWLPDAICPAHTRCWHRSRRFTW